MRIIKKGERVPTKERAELVEKIEKISKNLFMFEATGFYYDYLFGWGHGKKYWKRLGTAEIEFFAEVSELLATSSEGYNEIKRILPNAIENYHRIVEDILKEL